MSVWSLVNKYLTEKGALTYASKSLMALLGVWTKVHRSNKGFPNLYSAAMNVDNATTATTTTTTIINTTTTTTTTTTSAIATMMISNISTTTLHFYFLPLLHRFVYKPQIHSLFSVQWF